MSERRAYLDTGIGEDRGVLTIDGRPERLFLRRDGDDPRLLLGARLIARVENVEPALASAFLDLGGVQAIMPFKSEARPVRGAALTVEIRSEPRDGKLATVRSVGEGEGPPRLIQTPPPLDEVLRAFVREGRVVTGLDARRMADEAEDEALQTIHALQGGGTIAIEPTRALTAIDVDLGERKGADSKRAARQANLVALSEAARLLRLKGLGGLVVMDLVGRGHDGAALLAAARHAFGPDNPGVAIGPVGRFGTMELSIPRRAAPVLERLRRSDGGLTVQALAHRLVRRLESEGIAQPGGRLEARCAPDVALAAESLALRLAERIGARFSIVPDSSRPREAIDVGPAS